MIKERYVNFEVARLLKDKGFNEDYPKGDCTQYGCTQQMACDWVRTKEVLITYDLAPLGAKVIMVKVYKRVYDDPNYDWTEGITLIRDTLEEAINAALKFALEKLL